MTIKTLTTATKSTLNRTLHRAKSAKNDEFYTRMEDIAAELAHYKDQFKGKVIFCGCDDYKKSNFYKFCKQNFNALGIKRLVCSGVENADTMKGSYVEFNGKNETIIENCDGTFQTNIPKVVEKYGSKNVVFITNPPFSPFRNLVNLLQTLNVSYLMLANKNCITYKEVFNLFKSNSIRAGYGKWGGGMWFQTTNMNDVDKIVNGVALKNVPSIWVTNLTVDVSAKCALAKLNYDFSKPETLDSYYELSEDERNKKYPKYDNYDAINIDKSNTIPGDYFGEIGVPISFMYYLDPTVWEVVKFRKGNDDKDLCVNGKCPYFRVIIKRKK